jgi:uncharacterized protein (DUF2062 family)
MINLHRKIRYCYLRFRRLRGNPQKIALGMALGVFIGVTPTIPFHTIMALAFSHMFGVSRVAAFMGVWVSNPVTIPPLYYGSFIIGKKILYPNLDLSLPQLVDLQDLIKFGWDINLSLQLGGLILAFPAAILAYFFTLWALKRYRQQKLSLPDRALHLPQDPLPPA